MGGKIERACRSRKNRQTIKIVLGDSITAGLLSIRQTASRKAWLR